MDALMGDSDDLFSRALFEDLSSTWDRFTDMVRNMDMKGIFSVIMSIVVFATSENSAEVLEAIGDGIHKEIMAVKQPIDETIAAVGSSQCENVKKLFGLAYEQVKGEREPDLNQLTLVYRTRSTSRTYNISTAAESLRQARGIDSQQKLIIFVHGFTDDPYKDSFKNISDSFLQSGKANSVIALDGSPLIRWLYLRASTYVHFMGEKLGDVLASMVYSGQDPALIHMVGHSLGAHISGFCGKRFQQLTGKKLGRISGMDPAGPCFTNVEPTSRLNKTDAAYVDVVHTDSGVFGIREAVGDADYFPNNGMLQPKCLLQACSHSRSWVYYGESIVFEINFPAVRCDDWEAFQNDECDDEISFMGYPSKPGTKGLFFLQTGGSFPFGLGMAGTKYKNSNGVITNVKETIPKTVPLVRNLPAVGKLPIIG